MIIDKIMQITDEIGDLERTDVLRGEKLISFHGENIVRRTMKEMFKKHRIYYEVTSIKPHIVASNSVAAGGHVHNTMHVKVDVGVQLINLDDHNDKRVYEIGGTASGDDFSNASSTATTYAIRDWMRMTFQMTYDPVDDKDVQHAVPDLVLSESVAEDCMLLVSRNTAFLKGRAKELSFKPSSWNVSKMSHDDLFRLAMMMVHDMTSNQGSTMKKVAEALDESST